MKNYELLKKQNLDKHLKTLVLLAPKSYFYGFKKSFKTFEEILSHLNNKLNKTRLEIMFVDADVEDINKELLSLKLNLEWKKSKKEKYDYKAMLPVNDVKSLAHLLESKLEIKSWQKLHTAPIEHL